MAYGPLASTAQPPQFQATAALPPTQVQTQVTAPPPPTQEGAAADQTLASPTAQPSQTQAGAADQTLASPTAQLQQTQDQQAQEGAAGQTLASPMAQQQTQEGAAADQTLAYSTAQPSQTQEGAAAGPTGGPAPVSQPPPKADTVSIPADFSLHPLDHPIDPKAFTSLVGEALDLLRPYQLNPEGTGPAAPESAAVLAAAEQTGTFAALLAPANNSGVLGAALVHFDEADADVTIAVRASGLTPKQVHPQHIHGFEDDRPSLIPTIAVDEDLDGFLEGPEAAPVYGPVLLAATASGEVSQMAVSQDFPAADENGNLSFVQTYDFDLDNPEDAVIFQELQDRLVGRLFQIHGLELAPGHGAGTPFEVNGTGGYIPELAVANGVLLPVSLYDSSLLA